jgi:two-component system cell cycle response regulator
LREAFPRTEAGILESGLPAMENVPLTWPILPKRVVSAATPEACLVHIYPTGPGMGARLTIQDTPLTFGRDKDCDVHLDDPSVSRRHACIQPGPDGHYVVDLQSTNGTYLNDRPAHNVRIQDGNYLRIGNHIFRYLAGGNVEADYHEEIYRLTIIDGLTGIHNQRSLLEFLDRELARSARHQRPLALILFDLDHFKSVNDRLGHLAGDHTLRELVACVGAAIRKEELFSRYGGEEFAVVLPETTRDGAVQAAEGIRRLVEHHDFAYQAIDYRITVSLGVVATVPDASLTADDLIRLADQQLYAAKKAGRNRVMADDPLGENDE